MSRYDFRTPRLFVDPALSTGAAVPLEAPQAHYLLHVLRLKPGDAVLAFNGRDGEWQATLAMEGKRKTVLAIAAQTRAQPAPGRLHLAFAPLKHARLDYMVQKAVEMGAAQLVPVLTRHTQVARINGERMRANAIEAAEQCGILSVPDIAAPLPLERWLAAREGGRILVFCDEGAPVANPHAALSAVPGQGEAPVAADVLIGPEGGFSEDERALLSQQENVVRLALGPRILRADTAAVAALAVVQSAMGDWR
jgi:16S rRNA (uracil1498-N3)-methyltransferase